MFHKQFIKEMFSIVENYHNLVFWKVFLETVEEHKNHKIDYLESGASEYEMYFNFVVKNHLNDIYIRNLNWDDKPYYFNLEEAHGYDYVALCHWKHW